MLQQLSARSAQRRLFSIFYRGFLFLVRFIATSVFACDERFDVRDGSFVQDSATA